MILEGFVPLCYFVLCIASYYLVFSELYSNIHSIVLHFWCVIAFCPHVFFQSLPMALPATGWLIPVFPVMWLTLFLNKQINQDSVWSNGCSSKNKFWNFTICVYSFSQFIVYYNLTLFFRIDRKNAFCSVSTWLRYLEE